MHDSILISTKKMVGLAEDYTIFDLDIITHINATFVTVHQLGVGPEISVIIENAEFKWSDLELPEDQLSLVKVYMFYKVRMAFDPPTTSFHIEAMNKLIEECEHRLSYAREATIPLPILEVEEVEI